jgi:predicted nuclease of predicted toxin-antitoxin system
MLADLFPDSQHVRSLHLDQAPDDPLWAFARENDFVIVTKDVDFSDRSAMTGHPPKVIWIRIGNCSTSEIMAAIRRNHEQIQMFEADNGLGVFVLLG